eukprot:353436-Chlamydomonas_euryale.AAC.10
MPGPPGRVSRSSTDVAKRPKMAPLAPTLTPLGSMNALAKAAPGGIARGTARGRDWCRQRCRCSGAACCRLHAGADVHNAWAGAPTACMHSLQTYVPGVHCRISEKRQERNRPSLLQPALQDSGLAQSACGPA